MSQFQDEWQNRHGLLDDQFGEPILIVPRATGPYVAGGGDPNRPPFETRGVLDQNPKLARRAGRGGAQADNLDIQATKVVIDFSLKAFTGQSQWPRKGDRLTATSRVEAPEFEVVQVEPSGLGRVAFHCIRIWS